VVLEGSVEADGHAGFTAQRGEDTYGERQVPFGSTRPIHADFQRHFNAGLTPFHAVPMPCVFSLSSPSERWMQDSTGNSGQRVTPPRSPPQPWQRRLCHPVAGRETIMLLLLEGAEGAAVGLRLEKGLSGPRRRGRRRRRVEWVRCLTLFLNRCLTAV